MKITSYNNSINISNEIKAKADKKNIKDSDKNITETAKEVDILDITDDIELARLESIRAKIKSGFYNDPGIIRETAARLLRDIGEIP